jgi:hypothetical protein
MSKNSDDVRFKEWFLAERARNIVSTVSAWYDALAGDAAG